MSAETIAQLTFAPVPQKPDFFIVGAAKAGSTALWKYLSQHPQIGFSPIKETHFFSTDIDTAAFRPEFAKDAAFDVGAYIRAGMKEPIHQAFVRDSRLYSQLFDRAEGSKVLGEATVSYLWSAQAAANIAAHNPQAKVIAMLRNPAERAFSHYLMDLRMGYAQGSFIDAVEADLQKPQGWGVSNLYIELGRYHAQLQRYFKALPREQVLVLWYEDYKENPAEVLRQIFAFLGVDESVAIDTSARHNAARLPKYGALQSVLKSKKLKKALRAVMPASMKRGLQNQLYTTKGLPTITEADRAFVLQHLRSDIEALSLLLGRDLSHWLK